MGNNTCFQIKNEQADRIQPQHCKNTRGNNTCFWIKKVTLSCMFYVMQTADREDAAMTITITLADYITSIYYNSCRQDSVFGRLRKTQIIHQFK